MTASHTTDEPTGARVLEQRLARFRALRRELEGAVLPLATSPSTWAVGRPGP